MKRPMPAPQTFRVIDELHPRSFERAAMVAWRKALVEYLGGEAALDAIQTELVELGCRAKLASDRIERPYASGRRPPPSVRGADPRMAARKHLSGLLKLLRVGSAELGRTPQPGVKPLPSLDDLRLRPQRARK